MLINLFRRLFQDRKGAVALVMAIALVPLMIAGVTAVDMARIAAARTVLQASVDSAAIAGGGSLNTSGSTSCGHYRGAGRLFRLLRDAGATHHEPHRQHE